MDVRTDDNCRLWTAETGRGEPLVMCHGGPGAWDMTGALAAALAPRLSVIRWDQRGCGRSERRGPYSVARCAADLDAVIGPRAKTALFGHSWGATLALRYALDHPDRVSALVYACGTGLGWALLHPDLDRAPADLARGGADSVDSLERALPRVTRVTIPGAGHIPWLEEPEAVAGHLLDFLEHQAA